MFLLVVVLSALSASAVPPYQVPDTGPVNVTLEPLVGYELVPKKVPTPHIIGRFFYGFRIIAGYEEIAGEGEVTRAYDQETFPLQELVIRDTTDRAKLGIRRYFKLAQDFMPYARVGGQASRVKHETITFGASETKLGPIEIRPYIGGGLNYIFGDVFGITADGTIVFYSIDDFRKNEIQGSIAISGKIF